MAELIARHRVEFVRHVQDAEYWGRPVGTPITKGMKPKGKAKRPKGLSPVQHRALDRLEKQVHNNRTRNAALDKWKRITGTSHPDDDRPRGGRRASHRPSRDTAGHPHNNGAVPAGGKPGKRRATGKYTGPAVITDVNSTKGASIKAQTDRGEWTGSDQRKMMLDAINEKAEMAANFDAQTAEVSGREPRSRAEMDKIIIDGLSKFSAESRIAIRMKPARVKDLLDGDGKFLTMHTGGGAPAFPRTKDHRLFSEAGWYGEGNHPVSTYLSHKSVTDPTMDNNAETLDDAYGGIKLFFGDHVRDQATVTIGDSLNHKTRSYPSPLNNPSGLTANHDALSATTPDGVSRQLQMGGMSGKIEYVETHLHGDVTLDDVEEAQVPKGTPAAVIKKLEARGITVQVYE